MSEQREILFRGKRVDNGEWVYGYFYKTKDGETEISNYDSQFNVERFTRIVRSETVCQYTGIKDKNDKKIFFGDVAKTKTGCTVVVEFHCSCYFCGVTFDPIRSEYNKYTGYDLYRDGMVEVIGNIYDNPEFLEGENE